MTPPPAKPAPEFGPKPTRTEISCAFAQAEADVELLLEWSVAELRAAGYIPFVVMPLLVIWLAGAGQLAALSVRRYAPYPAPQDRPKRGPVRELIRTLHLAQRRRIGTLLQQFAKGDHVVGHRGDLQG